MTEIHIDNTAITTEMEIILSELLYNHSVTKDSNTAEVLRELIAVLIDTHMTVNGFDEGDTYLI